MKGGISVNESLLSRAATFLKQHRLKKRWRKVLNLLASIVVFVTTYALILPAITMEQETFCGIEEHIHDESCYEVQTTQYAYNCGEIHQHSDECYDENNHLICLQADIILHQHDGRCYDDEENLICQLSELNEHQHDENCYQQIELLNCNEEEGHQHTEDCYEWNEVLDCDLEEKEAHIHDGICYQDILDEEGNIINRELICIIEETEGHQHTEDCYRKEQGNLICALEETEIIHVHDESCYSIEEELICDQEEIKAHIHDETCFDKNQELICNQVELLKHQHDESCLKTIVESEENEALICEQEEHTHEDTCFLNPSEIDQHVAWIIEQIDLLPTSEEIEQNLIQYEDNEDDEGFIEYYETVLLDSLTVYVYYEELDHYQKELIRNADKLLELSWLWNHTLELRDEAVVYQINRYTVAQNVVVSGGTIDEMLGAGLGFDWWEAFIVEKNADGALYVQSYLPKGGAGYEKGDVKANGEDGFVLLVYDGSVDANVGDIVTVDFDYKNRAYYNSSGYGTITFTTNGNSKEDKDNTDELDKVDAADTSGYLTKDATNTQILEELQNLRYPVV